MYTLVAKRTLFQGSVVQLLVNSDGLWYRQSWFSIVFHHLAICCEFLSVLYVAVLSGVTLLFYPKYCYNTDKEMKQSTEKEKNVSY